MGTERRGTWSAGACAFTAALCAWFFSAVAGPWYGFVYVALVGAVVLGERAGAEGTK